MQFIRSLRSSIEDVEFETVCHALQAEKSVKEDLFEGNLIPAAIRSARANGSEPLRAQTARQQRGLARYIGKIIRQREVGASCAVGVSFAGSNGTMPSVGTIPSVGIESPASGRWKAWVDDNFDPAKQKASPGPRLGSCPGDFKGLGYSATISKESYGRRDTHECVAWP